MVKLWGPIVSLSIRGERIVQDPTDRSWPVPDEDVAGVCGAFGLSPVPEPEAPLEALPEGTPEGTPTGLPDIGQTPSETELAGAPPSMQPKRKR